MKRRICLLAITIAAITLSHTTLARASTCTVEQAIPSGQKQIGAGTATAEYDGVTTAKGDQKVYLQLKNANVLGVQYSISLATDTTPVNEICSYQALLPPQTSVILSGALFAEPPIGWKTTVSVQSDAGVVTYTLYSASGAATSNNKVRKSK
jgi:hypothetical protein